MSQSSTVDTINYISNEMNLYGYIVILVTGLFGNTINIIMFTTKLKGSVCSQYLLAGDISNNICLLICMLPSVIAVTTGKDATTYSVVWCRIVNYLIDICFVTSTWTICLAAVDRYLCSSRQASRRKWSSVKVAKYSIVVTILVSLCLGIPDALYWDINSDSHICISSQTYRTYQTYFFVSWMLTAAPLFILSIAGYMTYQNLRAAINPVEVATQNARKQRTDNQLARMLLVQIIVFLFQSTSLLIYFIYQQITLYWQLNDMQSAIQYLIQSFLLLINYSFISTSFYVYYLQSSRYRSGVNKMLGMKKRQEIGNNNSHQTNATVGGRMVNITVQAQPTIEL